MIEKQGKEEQGHFVQRTSQKSDDIMQISLFQCPLFLNLGFAKPMFCNPVLFTETTGITKMTKTTQTPTTTRSVAGEAKITETTEMTKTTGIWGAKPRFPQT